MNLIDHLLTFANEAAAFNVLKTMGFADLNLDEVGNIVWDRQRVIPNVKLITADTVWDFTNPSQGVKIVDEQTISGFHISIALPEASAALEAIPPKALRVIENRGLTAPDKAFHEYAVPFKGLPEGVASDMPAGQVNRVGGKIENLLFRISLRWFWHTEYPDPLAT